jgi:cell division protein FtsQ
VTVTTEERPATEGTTKVPASTPSGPPASAGPGSPKVALDPRLRARRISVRREAGRRRLRLVAVVGVVFVVALAAVIVARSPLLAVDDVQVAGAVYTDPVALEAVTGEVIGRPMLTVSTGDLEERLEALPWIRRADVWREWPTTLRVDVVERRPVATFYGDDGRYRVVDAEGRVVAVVDGLPVDVVAVAGQGPSLDAGAQAPPPVPEAAVVAAALPDALRVRLADVAPGPDGIILRLVDGPQVVLGTTDQLREKLVATLTVLNRLEPGTTGSLDVRVPDRPTLTPDPTESLTEDPS